MPQRIDITEEQIERAEKILLNEGHTFDEERRDFIKNLETINLHAVPGSGKTTALLAKLIALEEHLPFEDGSGILVLSHTNTAIDEFKNRIGRYCPKLFNYPNFVGTIQSFVDKFLAIPFYAAKYYQRNLHIEDESAKRYFEYQLSQYRNTRNYLDKRNDRHQLYEITFDLNKFLIMDINGASENFFLKNKSSESYENLKTIKINAFNNGYLTFGDAYYLAKCYVNKHSAIIKFLRKRFKYVFIDEMQDMGCHQDKLINDLFLKNSIPSVVQKIGDNNQAIFSENKGYKDGWNKEAINNTLEINGSHRLNPKIAELVTRFGVDYIEIEGKNTNSAIKPHLIIFNDDSIEDVIPKFAKLIKKYLNTGQIPNSQNNIYQAIGWRAKVDDPDKRSISSYYNQYNMIKTDSKKSFDTLSEYINACKQSENAKEISDLLYDGFVKLLRCHDSSNKLRIYTKSMMNKHLREKDQVAYNLFKEKFFALYKSLFEKDYNEEILTNCITHFLGIFDFTVNRNLHFIKQKSTGGDLQTGIGITNENVYREDDINIKVGTVHSVKGQTNTATLYLETYVNKGYESKRLKKILCGKKYHEQTTKEKETKINSQSSKMVYVGFSRPTHFLCFAVHEENYDKHLKDCMTNGNEWKVERI